MDVLALQQRLAAAGYDPGKPDGIIGPRTYAALFSFAAKRPLGAVGLSLGKSAAAHFPSLGLEGNALRLAHFLAQAAHETAKFQYFVELGGPSYCSRYEGRADLGNCQLGDGYRYRGRGIFQLTGRANYQSYGKLLGLDLLTHPEKAADPEVSLLIACAYWRSRKINAAADKDDCARVTKLINGGRNGLAEREAYTARLKGLLIS